MLRRYVLTATPARALRRPGWTTVSGSQGALPPDLANAIESLADAGLASLRSSAVLGLLDSSSQAALQWLVAFAASEARFSKVESDALVDLSPAAYQLGLSEMLLDAAEAYLGGPCLYLGATLKRETADGQVYGSRSWHRDVEDERMLRILIYLSDVGPGGGPLEYVPAPISGEALTRTGYRSGYLADASMRRMVEPRSWTEVHGGVGDAVFFDGARILHRAQPPRVADRYSFTLGYTSRKPLELRLTARLSKDRHRRLAGDLSPRQAACLPPPLRL